MNAAPPGLQEESEFLRLDCSQHFLNSCLMWPAPPKLPPGKGMVMSEKQLPKGTVCYRLQSIFLHIVLLSLIL
jgi:hypothetical protein